MSLFISNSINSIKSIKSINSINELLIMEQELLSLIKEAGSITNSNSNSNLNSNNISNSMSSRALIRAYKLKLQQIYKRMSYIQKRRQLNSLRKKELKTKAALMAEKLNNQKNTETTSLVLTTLVKELAKKSKNSNSKKTPQAAGNALTSSISSISSFPISSIPVHTSSIINSSSSISIKELMNIEDNTKDIKEKEKEETKGKEEDKEKENVYMKKAIEEAKAGIISASMVWERASIYKEEAQAAEEIFKSLSSNQPFDI